MYMSWDTPLFTLIAQVVGQAALFLVTEIATHPLRTVVIYSMIFRAGKAYPIFVLHCCDSEKQKEV